MSAINPDIYDCPICYELNDTAVSLNPCGHELHESCALRIIRELGNNCPECRTPIQSFRPALTTRKAVESLRVIDAPPPYDPLTIIICDLTGKRIKMIVSKEDPVALIFKKIQEKTLEHPHSLKFLYNHQVLDPGAKIQQYISSPQNEIYIYKLLRLGGAVVPTLFDRAKEIVGPRAANITWGCEPTDSVAAEVAVIYSRLYDQRLNEALTKL